MSDVKVIPLTDAYRDNWGKIFKGKRELKDGKVVIIPDAVCFRIMTEEGKSYHVFLDDQLTPLAAVPTDEIEMGGVVNERKLAGGGKGE